MEQPPLRRGRSFALHRVDPVLGNAGLRADRAQELLDLPGEGRRRAGEPPGPRPGNVAALSGTAGRDGRAAGSGRVEERRVGKEWVSMFESRGVPVSIKKKT